jgi:hypothetical protein
MKCPKCDGDMEEGEDFLKESLWDWIFFGLGSSDLYFKGESGSAELIIWAGHLHRCQRCKNCLTFVAEGGDKPTDSK